MAPSPVPLHAKSFQRALAKKTDISEGNGCKFPIRRLPMSPIGMGFKIMQLFTAMFLRDDEIDILQQLKMFSDCLTAHVMPFT